MDPPENSVNRIGRTIWTVWGYLSGAVARYLRPEVTEDRNQSVRSRADDIGLKSAVNKIDREVKIYNGDNKGKKNDQIDSTEVSKCSPSRVRVQVASVQWENTDVVKDDNNDELHVRTTKKQTRHHAVWSAGADTDNKRHTGDEKETASSSEVQAEKVFANTECEARESAQKTEKKKEECDRNHEDEKCEKRTENADNANVTFRSDQDKEREKQMTGFKHADEYLLGEKERIVDQKVQEKAEEQGLDSQDLLPQMKPFTEEADDLAKLERLEETTKYSDETEDVSKNEVEEMMPETGNAAEQNEENETAQDLDESGQLKQKHGDNDDEERVHEDEKCHMMIEDADVLVQSDLYGHDVEQDHAETEDVGGFEYAEEHPTDEKEKHVVEQKEQEITEKDEDQGTESQVQDLLPKMEYFTEEADDLSDLERLEVTTKYSDEIKDVSKNEIEEMMPKTGNAAEQDKENETAQDLEESGQLEQKDVDNEGECDWNHEDEKCHMVRKDLDNANIKVQSELYGRDVEQEKQISLMDHAETEDVGGFEHADEHPTDVKEKYVVDQKEQEMKDKDQGTESQAQDSLLQMEYFTEETDGLPKLDRLEVITKDSDENAHVCKNEAEEMMPETGSATDQDEENETAQRLEESGHQGTESQAQDLLPQMEYFTEEADLAQPERLKTMEKYSDEINEFSKKGVEEMMPGIEQDEDTTESEHNVTKYELTEAVETLQRVAEELSERNTPNVDPELKMTAVDETVDTLEDTLLSDSKQDTSENTPETGTGSHVVAVKTAGMFSDLMVCQFTGELMKGTALAETDLGCFEDIRTNLRDPLTPAEEQAEREAEVTCFVEVTETLKAFQTEQDTETVIESQSVTENQEIDKTEVSLKEHVELRTELIAEMMETEIGSEDVEAEVFEKESRSPVARNVTLQPHELPEFTEEQCKSSQGTMETFNEAQGGSVAGTAQIDVAEEHTDVKPISTRSLSPVEFLEEPLDLHGGSERSTEEQEILETDVAKTALEYVEEITNQVLKEMTDTECNMMQKTEPLLGFSTEEPADAEYQGAAQCVSADAFVLEEERKLLGETMDSMVETETASSEVDQQNEQHISSPECETTEADGRHEHIQKSIAGETVSSSHEDLMEVSRSGMKRGFDQVSKDLQELKTEGKLDLYLQAFADSSLDFTVQKARIAVKNPLVRPPKDPRKLLFKASLEPLLPQTSPRGQKVEVSAPSKGVIGFKLPGLGAEMPVLRKTEFGQKAREAERTLQPQQTAAAVTEDSVERDQVPAKPKWTPPKHPGMGSPFMMAELKSKLKKPVQE